MSGHKPVKLAYNKVEPGEGPEVSLNPIIFLHCLTGHKGYWKNIPKEVADATKRTVYAIDARNHGDSQWSDEFSIDIVAEDLFDFMDTHDIRKAILVGHSMGASAAIKAALKKPERVERLVVEDFGVKFLIDAWTPVMISSLSLFQEAVEATTPEMTEEEAKMSIAKFYLSNISEEVKTMSGPQKTMEDYFDIMYIKQKEDGHWMYTVNFAAVLEAVKKGGFITSDIEGTYEGPSCFIYGTISVFKVWEEKDDIKGFFPNADFVPIEGASHGMHIEKPKEFTEALLNFLSKNL